MGAQISEELTAWASVTDLAAMSIKMRIIPALPAECQVKVLHWLWRSLRWLPGGTDLVTPHELNDRLFLIVQGEAQVILQGHSYIMLLPEGSFACEAALLCCLGGKASSSVEPDGLSVLRRARRLPNGVLGIVRQFLARDASWPSFHGRLRTTRRSLVASLARSELLQAIDNCSDEDKRAALEVVNRGQSAQSNPLQNVISFHPRATPLGAQDMAALRVVCEGPMRLQAVCQAPVQNFQNFSLFSSCQGQRSGSALDETNPVEGL